MNKILRIDLTSSKLTHETIPEAILKQFIGGTGIGAKYLYEEVVPNVEWNDPENRLILATGPLTGTTVGGSGTFSLVTKGPLTNGAASVQANGFFGPLLKFSGFDGIIVQGAASRPVYLFIHDDTAELRDASHLWGKDTWQTQELIKRELEINAPELSVFAIGPAGENLVKFACIVGDGGHVAAHNGVGAVFGSKKLKAIAVRRGKKKIRVSDRQGLSSLSKELFKTVTSRSVAPFHVWGTLGDSSLADIRVQIGVQPAKNYITTYFPQTTPFSAELLRNRYKTTWTPCWACKFRCCYHLEITEGPKRGFEGEEPEYETMAAWTTLVGQNDNEEAFMLCNEVDRLGLDTNEAGWLTAWAMECYENGILTRSDTDGIEITWGNVDAIRALLQRIVKREGIGDILAEGVMRASQHFGDDASNRAIYTKKGNTPRCHDHRLSWVMLLDTCTSDTGTDADSGMAIRPEAVGLPFDTDLFSTDGASATLARGRGRVLITDSLVVCRFNVEGGEEIIPALLNAATGWDLTQAEVREVGLRIVNLFRAFNIRHGLTAELDTPSYRYASARTEGHLQGVTALPMWSEMLHNYYELMGWDRNDGKPLPETIKQLGLDQVIKNL
ncbi:MAG: aldehyde ferredoxin oxidoreductase family protein [Dehalococcoidia bacterium]|nr:MAG: aldehyde ferredoxin oxidoreductase family protein [Dehalococcoidia bacterium]